jgi:putative membrane protein
MATMIEEHRDNLQAFQSLGRAARSAEVRELVGRGTPVLQEHYNLARQIGSQVGADNDGNVAQTPVTGETDGSFEADGQFVRDVATAHSMEIRLGSLAGSRAENASVKQFARKMVNDHSDMQNQWVALASKHGMVLRAGIGQYQDQVNRLQSLSGREFDRAYMALMLDDHRSNLQKFQSQSSSARNADVRELVGRGIPVIQEHFNLAKRIGSQVGVDTTAVFAGQGGDPNYDGSEADAAFIREVVSDNLLETRLGEVAQNRSQNASVKQFARKMVNDHTDMQNQWTAMASRRGTSVTPDISQDQETIRRLQRMSRGQFDRAYMTLMVQKHRDALDAWRNQGRAAGASDLRELVERGIPALQEHFNLARQIGGQVGADTAATTQVAEGSITGLDRKFVSETAGDHLTMVRLGQLAERRGSDSQVKQYARKIVNDHSGMQQRWLAMSSKNGLPLNPSLGPLHKAKVTGLERYRNREFDRRFMTLMVEYHQDILSYFQKEGRAVQSAEVRELVERDLPALQEHANLAQQIGRRVGADVNIARNRRVSSDK